MKKVTHSVKSIRNLFKPKTRQTEQATVPSADPSTYPNYGYPSQQEPAQPDGFVESSVAHEDPLHFYGAPPEPPTWSRAGVRKGTRIDQQQQSPSIRQAEEAQYLEQQRYEQQLLEQQRFEQQRYEQQLRHDQAQVGPSSDRQSADIVAQPDHRPKRAIKANPKKANVPRTSAVKAAQTVEEAQIESPYNKVGIAEAVSTTVRSASASFRRPDFSLLVKPLSWSSRRVRGGLAFAAILLLLGGWLRFSGPSATAEQSEANNAFAVNEDLAIRSAGNSAAAQNSVSDGLAILSRPGADVNSADVNSADENQVAEATVQTVAQAISAAPTAIPTSVPPPTATATETPTPLPTFTPEPTATPTIIATEEIPDEIPAVNIIGSFFADLEASKAVEETGNAQVQRTATPTVTPTPLPLSPGRLWSTFVPGPPAQTDHFWIGRPFFASAKTQIASSTYQFGSTASSRYRVHYGVDISNPMGTEVRGATTGEVIHAGPDDPILLGPYNNFYGNAVVIRLDQRLPVAGGELDVFLLYGHLSALNVRVGDRVEPDDVVGYVGMRGIALGPHLHVEVRLGANTYNHIVNPYVWVEPIANTGAIAVRLLTADGRTWRSARVSLLRYENGSAVWSRYIETYSDDGYLGPDPAWGENGAMGSLRPGTYQVISVLNGERVKAEVQVRAGETTFVELRSKQ